MAWIESHQSLLTHPKTYKLANLMGWEVDTAIAKLHRFWWWCVDHAEDGDLRGLDDCVLASAVGVPQPDAKRWINAMCGAGWIDREPYFRVHDWWDYIGLFLQRKYSRTPEKARRIQQNYQPQEPAVQQPCGNRAKPKPEPGEINLSDARARLISGYKAFRNIDPADKGWDRQNLARCMRPAQSVLDAFGDDIEQAIVWLCAFGGRMEAAGRMWTLETAARHAWESKGERKQNERTDGKMAADKPGKPGGA